MKREREERKKAMNFYQYKITKKGEKPPVWRRCLIPADITFAQLAVILEDVTDAAGSAQYEFEFKTGRIRLREHTEAKSGYEELDAKETFVSELADSEEWFSFYPDGMDKKGNVYRIDREERLQDVSLTGKEKQGELGCPVIVKESEAAQKAFPTKFAAKNKELCLRYTVIREAGSAEKADMEGFEELARRLDRGEYGIVICPDAKGAYSRIDWMLSCQLMLSFLYGAAPIEVMHKMYCQRDGFAVSRLEFMDVFRSLSKEQNFCVVQDGKMIPKEALADGIYQRIESMQGSCSFYMPDVDEIMVYSRQGYPAEEASYGALHDFLEQERMLSAGEAEELMRLIYKKFSLGCDLQETLECLEKEGVVADQEMTALLTAAQADTRMLGLRGHTVGEWRQEEALRKQEMEKRQSTAGAGRAAGTALNAGRTFAHPRRKIYPNEPCPCGSGRKYKKCCAGK